MEIAEPSAPSAPANGWRCFHCDEVFTTERDARLHFGMDQCSDPACKIKIGAEKSLLVALRRAETELQDAWAAIHNETTEAAKAYYAQQSRHGEQLRAAEELGFERGIKDSAALLQENDGLRANRNLFAGKYRSIITLMDRARQQVQEIADHIEDEGDRAYLGSTNHRDWLRDLLDHMDSWSFDAMLPKGDINKMEADPYAEIRAQRARAEASEADTASLAAKSYDLASWAACINWRGGENEKDWLDELRQHIESVQALCKPYLPKSEAQQ